MKNLRAALASLAAFTLLTGVVYPLVVTLVAAVFFPGAATGSLVRRDGLPVGSVLLGQSFSSERYFHGRPSAAGAAGYDPMASGGSNLGPTSTVLRDRVRDAIAEGRAVRLSDGSVAADSVTTSASGLDPHISPENALAQVARVAAQRGLPGETVAELVHAATGGRILGFLGEPRVNVLELNLALDRAAGRP